MLDEYGLRLLAEIGVDVYAPRLPAEPFATPAPEAGAVVSTPVQNEAKVQAAARDIDVLILGPGGATSRLLVDLLRAFRLAGLRAEHLPAADPASLADVRSLVVLGDSLARDLGAGMPAQRQKAINWVITSDLDALARSASSKQGLWGEIKRLVRTLRASAAQS